MTINLSGKVTAVLGGDGREVEIARQLVATGATVRACGLPPGVESVRGVDVVPSVAQAVAGADIIICPIPLPEADGAIFAPHSPVRVVVDTATLGGAKPGAVLITGKAGPHMRQAASTLGLRLFEYEQDEELMLLRAPAIAEGAIRAAIEHTEVTLHANRCLVVGFGKIGPSLARTLLGMGARVTVVARNPVQLARAWEMGCETVHLQDLAVAVQGVAVVFNTAPAPLIDRQVLEQVDPDTVIIDLSAPPGGVDWEAVQALGLKAVWARGLGGRAPRTVGRSQWIGIQRILTRAL